MLMLKALPDVNPSSEIKLSETANFVYKFIENQYKRATLVAHLTNFSFTVFTQDASLLFLDQGKKKSQNGQKST